MAKIPKVPDEVFTEFCEDMKKVFGDETVMPAFYRTSNFHRVADKFAGKTILSAQQVEDVVAYLATLK